MSCTEDLSGLLQGEVSSPSWPASYAENANCQHTLSVEDHLQLELHFSEDFDVEQSPEGPCIDALRVRIESKMLFFLIEGRPDKLITSQSRKQRGSSEKNALKLGI